MKLLLQLWLATAGVFFFPPDPPLKLSFSLHAVWVVNVGLPQAVFALRQCGPPPVSLKKAGRVTLSACAYFYNIFELDILRMICKRFTIQ